jgi:hypothetical protein
MPTLYIVSSKKSIPVKRFTLLDYPGDFPEVFEKNSKGIFAVVTDEGWALSYNRLSMYPNWKFVRVVDEATKSLSKDELDTVMFKIKKCVALDNYSVVTPKAAPKAKKAPRKPAPKKLPKVKKPFDK